MYQATVAKAHFVLGRMHVDVHCRGVQIQVENISGVATVVEHILIGLTHRVGHQLIFDGAPVDVKVLEVRLAARESRPRHPPPQLKPRTFEIDKQGVVHKRGAANLGDAPGSLGLSGRRAPTVDDPAVVFQRQADLKGRQRQALEHVLDTPVFGIFCAKEFAPRRGIEKQIADLDRGAYRVRRRFHRGRHIPPFGNDAIGAVTAFGQTCEHQTRHRTDARQSFAAKAERGHRFEIIENSDFAGGMTRKRKLEVFALNAATVVAHAHQLNAAGLDLDIYLGGAGVHGIFQQLFDHRGGTLNHFSGGDLVGEPGAQ